MDTDYAQTEMCSADNSRLTPIYVTFDRKSDAEQTPWVLTLTGSDLMVTVLIVANVTIIVAYAVLYLCACSKDHGKHKQYQMVRIVAETDCNE